MNLELGELFICLGATWKSYFKQGLFKNSAPPFSTGCLYLIDCRSVLDVGLKSHEYMANTFSNSVVCLFISQLCLSMNSILHFKGIYSITFFL